MNGSEGSRQDEMLHMLEEMQDQLEAGQKKLELKEKQIRSQQEQIGEQKTKLTELSWMNSQLQEQISDQSSRNSRLENENRRIRSASEYAEKENRELRDRNGRSLCLSLITAAVATLYALWENEIFKSEVTGAVIVTADATVMIWDLAGELLGRIVTDGIVSILIRAVTMAALLTGVGWLIWKLTRNVIRRQADVMSAAVGMTGLMTVSVLGPVIRKATSINLLSVWAAGMALYAGVRAVFSEEDKEKRRKIVIWTVTGIVMVVVIGIMICVLIAIANKAGY